VAHALYAFAALRSRSRLTNLPPLAATSRAPSSSGAAGAGPYGAAGRAGRLLRRLGAPPEPRKYTPHVTLARLRGAAPAAVAAYLGARGYFPSLKFEATRFVLYSSRDSWAAALHHRGGISAGARRVDGPRERLTILAALSSWTWRELAVRRDDRRERGIFATASSISRSVAASMRSSSVAKKSRVSMPDSIAGRNSSTTVPGRIRKARRAQNRPELSATGTTFAPVAA